MVSAHLVAGATATDKAVPLGSGIWSLRKWSWFNQPLARSGLQALQAAARRTEPDRHPYRGGGRYKTIDNSWNYDIDLIK